MWKTIKYIFSIENRFFPQLAAFMLVAGAVLLMMIVATLVS